MINKQFVQFLILSVGFGLLFVALDRGSLNVISPTFLGIIAVFIGFFVAVRIIARKFPKFQALLHQPRYRYAFAFLVVIVIWLTLVAKR